MNNQVQCSPLPALNHDQHHGSLFARELRERIGNGTSLDTLKEFSKQYWKNYFRSQFNHEESVLIPYIKNETLVLQLKQEHQDIESLFASLGSESERSKFSILARFIENHIRFQSQQLFPFLVKTLSPEEFEQVMIDLEMEVDYIN
jgi:hypothetical protein